MANFTDEASYTKLYSCGHSETAWVRGTRKRVRETVRAESGLRQYPCRACAKPFPESDLPRCECGAPLVGRAEHEAGQCYHCEGAA